MKRSSVKTEDFFIDFFLFFSQNQGGSFDNLQLGNTKGKQGVMKINEGRIATVGAALFAGMKGQQPGLFNKAWWSGQILEWAMKDPGFKTEMFRFVDVFPTLRTPEEVYRHIQEYLLRPGVNAPTVIKAALKGAGLAGFAKAIAARQIAANLEGMAKQFILGATPEAAFPTLRTLRQAHQGFTVDLLGEASVSEGESGSYARRYLVLMEQMQAEASSWSPDLLLDTDDQGAIPRVNVSIKVSAMYSQLDPLAFDESVTAVARQLLPIFLRARQLGVFLNLDAETSGINPIIYAAFKQIMEDQQMKGYEHVGVVVQAYLRNSLDILRDVIAWAKAQKSRITVRLVKGAYWDYETVRAAQEGWPSPVWASKGDTDACFEACAQMLLENHQWIRAAFASHNLRSLAHTVVTAEQCSVPVNGYEVQCLYGMAEPIRAAVVARGHRLRVYAPVGELLPGMAYLVRRLLENTSNQSWLRMGFVEGASQVALLAAPNVTEFRVKSRPISKDRGDEIPPFENEPLRDFTDPEVRAAFAADLRSLGKALGREYGPVVNGKSVAASAGKLSSLDPADGRTVIATVHLAGVGEAVLAVEAAKAYFPIWRDTPASERAACLFRLAAVMRQKRDFLAALMVREVGKPWREADGDVCEAIDFCEYYAREALRLAIPRPMQPGFPGETNFLSYEARGVTLVIAPWNFPLAILTGMMSAALVMGNPVIMKPAEQSMVIACQLMALAREAKIPVGALHLLPGYGDEIGAHLVAHKDVATIVFTGSREVGLQIWKQAGITHPGQASLKRVVCEMGGKNAIIVDSDADQDEATLGVIQSACGYAGQKCSACSRVIVIGDHYETFVSRLADAMSSLKLCLPSDPSCRIPPVIDLESQRRIEATIAAAETRGLRRLCGRKYEGPGYFVEPTLFVDVPPGDDLAQQEIFGPVLAVIRAKDLNEALEIANGTPFALTGGIYSRSPANIEVARRGFRVGNLYINRPITGAMVGRHPFGGFHMSGGGTKAGGPDYLLNFVDPRVVSENTMRRGFVPSES